jgi:hypothetical protein
VQHDRLRMEVAALSEHLLNVTLPAEALQHRGLTGRGQRQGVHGSWFAGGG